MSADDVPSRYSRVSGRAEYIGLSWSDFTERALRTALVPQKPATPVRWHRVDSIPFSGAVALPESIGEIVHDGVPDSSIILRAESCQVQLDVYHLNEGERGTIPYFDPGRAHIVRGARYFECEFWKAGPDELIDLDRAHQHVRAAYLRGGWDMTRWLVIVVRSTDPLTVMRVLECIDIREQSS